MTLFVFEVMAFTPHAFAEPEATAASMAAAAQAKEASEETVKISTALVPEQEFSLKGQAGKEPVSSETKQATGSEANEASIAQAKQQESRDLPKKPVIVRTLKKVDGKVSWVGIKSIALNYLDEFGHEFDTIFPLEKKLTLSGYDSILDIQPGDQVHMQYEEAAEEPGTKEESVSLSLKSVKRIRTGEQANHEV